MYFLSQVFLAVNFLDILWHFLGAVLVLVCLAMILVILVQDSKGAGLTSAFGAGPGGESLLGARMQKDVARLTAILAAVFAVIVITMGLMGTCRLRYGSAGAAGAKTTTTTPAPLEAPSGDLKIELPPPVTPNALTPTPGTVTPIPVTVTPNPVVPTPTPPPTPAAGEKPGEKPAEKAAAPVPPVPPGGTPAPAPGSTPAK